MRRTLWSHLPVAMKCSCLALLVCTTAAVAAASETLRVTAHRPAPSTWKRTACGSPSGTAGVPAGVYTTGVDYPGNDMAPCGSKGCVLEESADHLDCERKCNSTQGCIAYIFAPANCSGVAGPICWTKDAIGGPDKGARCRNSRIMGSPAVPGADIPSRWADQANASSTPWVAYPRPQMARGSAATFTALRDHGDPSVWTNLNGLWEWEAAAAGSPPPVGKTLGGSILVPFPVESCLSGVAPNTSASIVTDMWYRLTFDAERTTTAGPGTLAAAGATLLHFGAIDWQSSVYLNGVRLGNHTGGYDGFSYDVTAHLRATGNELLVYAHDPSDSGKQPNGKQRITAIDRPGGDTYTPSSGIWQTVWLEAVPAQHIANMKLNQASTSELVVNVTVAGAANQAPVVVGFRVTDATGKQVGTASGVSGSSVTIAIPSARLWSPSSPYLYNLEASIPGDSVVSYFGLRTFELGDGPKGKRPLLNGNYTFMAGFLDQSWWPDGQ